MTMPGSPADRHRWSASSEQPALFVALAVGGISAAASVLRPLSFDEAYWLVFARRIFGAGDLPYWDLLDNKGPLLYGLVGLADLVPGPDRVGLTALFTTTVVALALGIQRLAASSGQPPASQLFTTALVTLAMSALSVWSVTTELLAGAILVWALVARRPWWSVALLLGACLIDPRAVLFGPVVLFSGIRDGRLERRHVYIACALAAVAMVPVLAIADLRYAFVEWSLSNRFDAPLREVLLVAAAALAPLAVLATLRIRITGTAVAMFVVSFVIGASAGLPFGHYWVYLPLTLGFVRFDGTKFGGRVPVALGVASLLLILLATRGHLQFDVDQAASQTPLAAGIEQLTRPDDRVVIWGGSPHLRVPVASRTLGFAPTSNYFAWGLPRSERLLDRLRADLEEASLLVVAPGLEPYRGLGVVAEALVLVEARAAEAACSSDLDAATAYRFADC
jgi:hypothetical protein